MVQSVTPEEKDSSSSGESPRERLRRKRSCTDVPCCVLLLLFILCFVLLSIFAFQEGDPQQLIRPTDSNGNLCGRGEKASRPYVYFFDWTKCFQSLNLPSNLLKGKILTCPTKQICVDRCPNKTSFYRLKDYSSHVICTDDVRPEDATQEEISQLVNEGQCPSYVLASKPLFGRCVPEQLQSLANQFLSVTDENGNNVTITDPSGTRLNGSKIEEGVKYLVELLNVKEIGSFLLEDFFASWKLILIGLLIGSFLSFVWIVLMRCLIKPIIWLSIFCFFVLLIVLTSFSFFEFNQLRKKNGNEIFTEFEFVTDANYYRSLPITWLVVGIVLLLVLIVFGLIFLFLFPRLRKALSILTEASKAVSVNFLSLFWPFVPFVLQLSVFVYWIALALFLTTSGKPIYRRWINETVDEGETFELREEICYPNASDPIDSCYFSHFGYDPQVDLDRILNGTGKHFQSFISFVNQHQWIPQIYALFMFFWLTAFVVAFGQLVLAGVFARYYWDGRKVGAPCSSLLPSIGRALGFHMGTLAFGSLLIALVKLIRVAFEYVEKKTKSKTGVVGRCLGCCCRCCLFCLEKFLKFLNRNAYIITAIYGTGFFTSARRAFAVIIANPIQFLVLDKICDFLILISKLSLTAAMGVLSYFFFTSRIPHADRYVPELHYYFLPLLFIVVGTYIITSCFFTVYSMAVDTLFLCALQDLKLKRERPNHQLAMSRGLQKVFKPPKESVKMEQF